MSAHTLGRRLLETFRIRRPSVPTSVAPGLYHFQTLEGEWPTRFHLRVDEGGGGLLLANAAQAALLSPTGVLMARGILAQDQTDERIVAEVAARFCGASRAQIGADLAAVRELIATLSAPGDNYPITNLDDPYASDRVRSLSAPLRADIVAAEAETVAAILRRLWEIGVPQATFLVRPTSAPQDVVRMVEAAGDLGMIAGLNAPASWLSSVTLSSAAMAGLDFVAITWASASSAAHDALTADGDHSRARELFGRAAELEVCRVAHVPLVAASAAGIGETLAGLAKEGVTNAALYALAAPDDEADALAAGALPAAALPQVAAAIQEASEEAVVRYLWEPPQRFDPRRTLQTQVLAGPRAGGDMTVRVEPDGSVIPPRGPATCAGNVLTDAWKDIWGSDCFRRYRDRLGAPTRCSDCPGLAICAADCPRDPLGWADDSAGGEPQ